MTFQITPSTTQDHEFEVAPVPAPATPPPTAFGGLIQFRLNGVDLGDNRVGVIDWVTD
jgi:hypothetical protein